MPNGYISSVKVSNIANIYFVHIVYYQIQMIWLIYHCFNFKIPVENIYSWYVFFPGSASYRTMGLSSLPDDVTQKLTSNNSIVGNPEPGKRNLLVRLKSRKF